MSTNKGVYAVNQTTLKLAEQSDFDAFFKLRAEEKIYIGVVLNQSLKKKS